MNLSNISPDRRQFLAGLAASGAASLLPRGTGAAVLAQEAGGTVTTVEIADVLLDLHRVHKWDDSNGDTWDPFWADDDALYAFNCDGRGFGAKGMNLAFNRLTGSSPETLVGSQINEMDEYGRSSQKGPDNATWKACGQECIDGVFYAFIARNIYGSDSRDPLTRQLAMNSSLIKSSDRGHTWTRSAQENYDQPMWPGRSFGAPCFVHYGKNGGQTAQDGAREYVYACSTNGFWGDGDLLVLGRIRRSLLPQLNPADWEYYSGGDGGLATAWSGKIEDAAPILERPAKCGQTPITYVPALNVYLLISWYNTERMTRWFEPNEMRYDFFQAPHPWGPWKQINSVSDRFLGPGYHMYGPSLCARFQELRGADLAVSLFTAGCPFDDVAAGPYKIWHIPAILKTAPSPPATLVSAADLRIRYHGAWYPWTTVESADAEQFPRATQTKSAAAELTFEGTGIEYVAQKSLGLGTAQVSLDGVVTEDVSLRLDDFPVFLGVTVFSKQNLPLGNHTIRVANSSDSRINLEAFRVFP